MSEQLALFATGQEPVTDTISTAHSQDNDPTNSDRFWSLCRQWLTSHPDFLKDVPSGRIGRLCTFPQDVKEDIYLEHGGCVTLDGRFSSVSIIACDTGALIEFNGRPKPSSHRVTTVKEIILSSKHDSCFPPEATEPRLKQLEDLFTQIHNFLQTGFLE